MYDVSLTSSKVLTWIVVTLHDARGMSSNAHIAVTLSLFSHAPKVGENSSVTGTLVCLSHHLRRSYEEREILGRDMLEMGTGVVYTRNGNVSVESLMVDMSKPFLRLCLKQFMAIRTFAGALYDC